MADPMNQRTSQEKNKCAYLFNNPSKVKAT